MKHTLILLAILPLPAMAFARTVPAGFFAGHAVFHRNKLMAIR